MRDHLDPVFGRALEDEYAGLVTARGAARIDSSARSRGTRSQAVWVTVAVGVAVAIAAVFAIRAGQEAVPPAGTSSSSTGSGLLQRLPKQPYGQTIHTWTDLDGTTATGPFRFVGRTAVIAAVCEGGGAISITDVEGSAHRLGCSQFAVQQPFARFNLGGDGRSTKTTGPVHVAVKVLSGTPRYAVRLWAVDPRILDADQWSVARTSPEVPASLRTCTTTDLAPRATVAPVAGTHSGVVTISSRSTTDCAVRAWPTMQYLAADGSRLGPIWGEPGNGMSLDSSEGKLNKYGEFPPARLTAGGSAYLIVDLVTRSALQQEDAQNTPAPTPSGGPVIPQPLPCGAERVGSIRLGFGSASTTVDTSTVRDLGACRTDSRVFGVNPVVAERPVVQG